MGVQAVRYHVIEQGGNCWNPGARWHCSCQHMRRIPS